MMRKFALAGIATAASIAAATSLFAQQPRPAAGGLVDATNPSAVLDIAKGYGGAEMETSKSGDPRIVGRIDGTRYVVFFEGCKENKNCKNIQFYAGWNTERKLPQERMNEWNKTKRWGKAYLDNQGDPAIEMDVNLFGGVSRQNLDDTFDWWKVALREFKKYITE